MSTNARKSSHTPRRNDDIINLLRIVLCNGRDLITQISGNDTENDFPQIIRCNGQPRQLHTQLRLSKRNFFDAQWITWNLCNEPKMIPQIFMYVMLLRGGVKREKSGTGQPWVWKPRPQRIQHPTINDEIKSPLATTPAFTPIACLLAQFSLSIQSLFFFCNVDSPASSLSKTSSVSLAKAAKIGSKSAKSR